jgi:hypothetical protein
MTDASTTGKRGVNTMLLTLFCNRGFAITYEGMPVSGGVAELDGNHKEKSLWI